MKDKPSKNTPASNHYEEYFGPMYFEPYAVEVTKLIDPSRVSNALELAAGTGRVTRHIRERIMPAAKLIASDISEDMMSVARKKLQHLDIDWQHIDAQRIPFNDEYFDLVVCCFGYMFVPDRQAAFAEAHRVLKAGGSFLFTTWDRLEQNEASYTARKITEEFLGEPLPAFHQQATSMSEDTVIIPLLRAAGFADYRVDKIELPCVSPTADHAAYTLVCGGQLYEEIKKRNPQWVEAISAQVAEALAAQFGAAPMVARMSAVIGRAWK